MWGAVGVGTFSSLAYVHFLKPVWAVVWSAIWAAAVGLFTRVWEHLENTFTDVITEWLDPRIRDFIHRYQRKYFEHLIFRHRTFDVKGLNYQGIYALEIEEVYVDLSMEPNQFSQVSPSIAQTGPSTGRQNIWDFLNAYELKTQNFAIIGAPGSGKTTLLKHITLCLAAKNGRAFGLRYVPILLFIRDHADSVVARNAISLEDVIMESVSKMGLTIPAEWFRQLLAKGRCLVLFDGLDEIAAPASRNKVATWVQQQMGRYGHNRFILSSRPFGYRSNPLSGVTVLEVRPFNLDQVRKFVERWYFANEIRSAQKNDLGVKIAATEGANDLMRRLRRTPALLDLALNPLLLTMITTVHRYRGSLPGRRVELYAEICDVFLGKRQQARGLELELTPAQKKRVLQPLAFYLMVNQKREISLSEASTVIDRSLALVSPKMTCADFLQMTENSSGLLLEREAGVYNFAHLTFQEYLAAAHMMEARLEPELVKQVSMSWWHETIRLYAAIGEASCVIEACISGHRPSVGALTLAVECVEDARAVEPALRIAVNSIITEGAEDADPERRRLAGETMLNLRLRSMVRLDDDRYIDDRLITVSEYQLFCDVERSERRFRQPDSWPSAEGPKGKNRDEITGIRLSDAKAFCAWLSDRDSLGWVYELPQDVGGSIVKTQIGYWTCDGRVSHSRNAGVAAPMSTLKALDHRLSRDRELLKKNHLALDFSEPIPIELEKELPVLASVLIAETPSDLTHRAIDLELDFDRIFALDEQRVLDVNRVEVVKREQNMLNAQTIDNDFGYYVARFLRFFDSAARQDIRLMSKFERVRRFHQQFFGKDNNFVRNLRTARNLAYSLQSSRNISSAFDASRIFDSELAKRLTSQHSSTRPCELARATFRLLALYCAIKLSREEDYERKSFWRSRKLPKDIARQARELSAAFFHCYITLGILEERIEGTLDAFEGLRIAKVRRDGSMQS